jgi:CheY-like chemotaxis protein
MARILVVDDDPDQLEIRKLLLQQEGHTVWVASSADDARSVFPQTSAEIALMDIRIPRPEDGLALIRWLRQASQALRIIVLSGWAADLASTPEAALVDGMLTKPVRTGMLLDLIRDLAPWT